MCYFRHCRRHENYVNEKYIYNTIVNTVAMNNKNLVYNKDFEKYLIQRIHFLCLVLRT